MNLSEQILPWEALRPNLNFPQLSNEPVDFFDLQPRAGSAVVQFLQNPHRTLLVLKADALPEYAEAVENFVSMRQNKELAVSGVRYVIEQADSFSFARVQVRPAQSSEDNFAAKKSVAAALYFDQSQLLGSVRIHPTSHDIELNAGLVHQLNNGVLILSVSALLERFELWARLKQILLSRTFDWYSAHPFKALPCEIPSYPLSLKVILLGNRADLALLAESEPDLYDLADYSELDNFFTVENDEQQCQWAQYVRSFAHRNGFAPLTRDGLNRLYQLLVRESEDRTLINISPPKLKEILSGADLSAENKELDAAAFERYFQQRACQQGFLREQTYADILHEQIYVETEGEAVGQINGLSVIEYAGTPLTFGEPARMSCIVQFGDGEVIDIERKSELAGNIHGKGIMIAQACLANILDFPSQLPFSASLVFEQSYGEIDGDSASLAAFCVLVSALADLPVPQSVAVTGSIDQFGMVHPVGGINDKIEGFFTICARRGLTGKQGVIIPYAAIGQLSLSEEVISAVKNQQFFVWAADDVFQACEILFARNLTDGKPHPKTPSVARLIMRRIEQRAMQQPHLFGFWLKLFGKK